MKLMTKAIKAKLEKNAVEGGPFVSIVTNAKPVLKLFTPYGSASWLITELAKDGDTMFGLCDLGLGEVELGYVSLAELEAVAVGPFGMKIERDLYFKADKTLQEYAEEALINGSIIT